LSGGQDRVSFRVELPMAAISKLEGLLTLLHEADGFCRDRQLLTLQAGPQEWALRRWYIGEFIRQSRGQAPQPWTGAFAVADEGRTAD
jgi:hypothetical protein